MGQSRSGTRSSEHLSLFRAAANDLSAEFASLAVLVALEEIALSLAHNLLRCFTYEELILLIGRKL